MKKYIGIDLGGTNVRAAVVDALGNVLCEVKQETEMEKGREYVVAKMISMIKSLDDYQSCVGIGIAVPGPVKTDENVMTMATNVPGFEFYEFYKIIEKEVGLPVFLDNDVNSAALAEAVHGAGKNDNIIYYVTVSTGIGGAAVINKKVLSGRFGYAGEIGNIIIDRNRKKYNHLNIGAVENEASGLAMIRRGSELFNTQFTSAKQLFDLVQSNDPNAIKLVDDIAYDLAVMLSSVAHVIDPHVFVFGGGVMQSKDLFLPLVKKYFDELVHEAMRDIRFELAQLKEPGIVGAAMLAKESM